jgi:hypothetical protein
VVNSTFTMSDGEISGNGDSTQYGGGVYIQNESSCSFNLSGGAISDNTAAVGGGGVMLGSSNTGSFTMSGGVIYGRDAGALANTSAYWASAHTINASSAADAFNKSKAWPYTTADALFLSGASPSNLVNVTWGDGTSKILDHTKYTNSNWSGASYYAYSPDGGEYGLHGWGYGGTVTGGTNTGTLWHQ